MMIAMNYEMPKLPYAHEALEPVISQQTVDWRKLWLLPPTVRCSTMPDRC